MICPVCQTNQVTGKAKTCSPTCRKKLSRSVTLDTPTVTASVTKQPSVTSTVTSVAPTPKRGYTAEGTPTNELGQVFNVRLNQWVMPGICKFGECHDPKCRYREAVAA